MVGLANKLKKNYSGQRKMKEEESPLTLKEETRSRTVFIIQFQLQVLKSQKCPTIPSSSSLKQLAYRLVNQFIIINSDI